MEIKTVVATRPQIKITRLFTNLTHVDEVLQQIRDQNKWIVDAPLEVREMFVVKSKKGNYTNLTLFVDLDWQKKILEHGKVIFGMSESKCYEHVNLTQCAKCYKFGHYAKECQSKQICRKCAESHLPSECTSTASKCSNCIVANKKGNAFNTRHRASDDRCPCRIERLESLKKFLTAKNLETKK